MALPGSMLMARCSARTANSVSPFFSRTFPIKMYGPLEFASSQMERSSILSASSNFCTRV